MKNIRDIEGLVVAGSKGYFVTSEILEKNGTAVALLLFLKSAQIA
jgi:hypothetical protein